MSPSTPIKRTVFAQEGFVSQADWPLVKDPTVKVINIHRLSDCIVFTPVDFESRDKIKLNA